MGMAEQVNDQAATVAYPVAKGLSAGAVTLGGLTLGEWAAVTAIVFNFLLIGEWMWKKAGRPYAESRGWLKPKRHRKPADD